MKVPSVRQYQDVIANHLTPRRIEILQTLYYFPNSSANAKELARALNYTSFAAANRQVGHIGKLISQHTHIVPAKYERNKVLQPQYFLLVGEYGETGWVMWPQLRRALENLNLVSDDANNSTDRLPTETFQFEEKELFKEGKVVEVFVNRYERNQKARQECIRQHGSICFACGFDFGKTYGDIAKGHIHIHHLTQLSDINIEYHVDPINDLVPVCANCHSVIHLAKPALTIGELKKLIKKGRK